jgi:cell wall assembly regulator SMI1
MLTSVKEELRQVLKRIVAARTTWLSQALDDEVVVQPGATEEALAGLTSARHRSIPASYLELLRIHDGIDEFFGIGGELLSSSYRGESDSAWADCCTEWNELPDLDMLLLIAADDDGSCVAFDMTTLRDDGEADVVAIQNFRSVRRYPSLLEYLRSHAEAMEARLTKDGT